MMFKNQHQFEEEITVRRDILNLQKENILEAFPDISTDHDFFLQCLREKYK